MHGVNIRPCMQAGNVCDGMASHYISLSVKASRRLALIPVGRSARPLDAKYKPQLGEVEMNTRGWMDVSPFVNSIGAEPRCSRIAPGAAVTACVEIFGAAVRLVLVWVVLIIGVATAWVGPRRELVVT